MDQCTDISRRHGQATSRGFRSIAKASYISPKVFAAYEQGLTLLDFAPRGKCQVQQLEAGHTAVEIELMKLLATPVLQALRVSMFPTGAGPQPRSLART